MDMKQGFNQIEMLPEHKERTAFWVSNRRWQWRVMSFGLKIAGACFQKVMDDALAEHTNAKCCIDDVLIYSRTFEEHLQHIAQVFSSIPAESPSLQMRVRRTGGTVLGASTVSQRCQAHGGKNSDYYRDARPRRCFGGALIYGLSCLLPQVCTTL